jgi:hypothetical protein
LSHDQKDKDDDATLILTIGEGASKLMKRTTMKELLADDHIKVTDRVPARIDRAIERASKAAIEGKTEVPDNARVKTHKAASPHKSSTRTAKSKKKEEGKTEVKIYFYSTRGGGGSYNSETGFDGGFGR